MSVAATDVIAASRNPHVLATASTSSRYAKPAVVAFTGTSLNATNVMIATAPRQTNNRNTRLIKSAFEIVQQPGACELPVAAHLGDIQVENPRHFVLGVPA